MSEIFKGVRRIFENTFSITDEQMLLENLHHVFTVVHTLAGFKQLTKNSDEEFRSASFMGDWSSTIGFYNLISALGGEEVQHKVLANALSKKNENSVGADFGIAVQVKKDTGGEIHDFYRLAYFQAKNNKSIAEGRQTFHIDQIKSAASQPQLEKAANLLKEWVLPQEYPRNFDFHDECDAEYQVYTLGRHDKGLGWTHYVIWHDGDILSVSTKAIWHHLKSAGIHLNANKSLNADTYSIKLVTNSTTNVPDISEPVTFQDLLLSAVNDSNCPAGWREVLVEEASDIIDGFVELGSTWYVQSDSSGDGGLEPEIAKKHIKLKIVNPTQNINHFTKYIPVPPRPKPTSSNPKSSKKFSLT